MPRGLAFLGPWLVSAARPTHFAALTADLGPAGRLGGWGPSLAWKAVESAGRSERASRACPQEEPLLQVLLGLGVEDDELSDLHAVEGVVWRLGPNFIIYIYISSIAK